MHANITDELRRLGINARAVVIPTSWTVGPVVAYLFPDEPVTIIDSGVASGRPFIEDTLAREGLVAADVRSVIVTHSHSDHIGGARWLQESSGCRVMLHRSEIEMISNPDRKGVMRALFEPLGFDTEKLDAYASRAEPALPELTPVDDDQQYGVGNEVLRIERRPGHTPGHLWITHMGSGAIFSGDYLLASSPTNPGMALDSSSATGRMPMLALYIDGLKELAARNAPALFTGHGPPVTDVAGLVERRLTRIERRTKRIRAVLADVGETTAAALADVLYRGRAHGSWDVMAEVVGHLDLLVTQRRATCTRGKDGYWHFAATSEGGSDA